MKRKSFIKIVGGAIVAIASLSPRRSVSEGYGRKMVSPSSLGYDFNAEAKACDFSVHTMVLPRESGKNGLKVAALKVVNGEIIDRHDVSIPRHNPYSDVEEVIQKAKNRLLNLA